MRNTLYICIIRIGTIMTLPIQALGHNPSYERNARPINFFANPEVIPAVGAVTQKPYAQYAQYDNALEGGHNATNQYVNSRVGYCNTLGVG